MQERPNIYLMLVVGFLFFFPFYIRHFKWCLPKGLYGQLENCKTNGIRETNEIKIDFLRRDVNFIQSE